MTSMMLTCQRARAVLGGKHLVGLVHTCTMVQTEHRPLVSFKKSTSEVQFHNKGLSGPGAFPSMTRKHIENYFVLW